MERQSCSRIEKAKLFSHAVQRGIPVIQLAIIQPFSIPPFIQGGTDLKLCVYVAVLFSALLALGATSSILDMTPPIARLSLADLRDSFEEDSQRAPS